MGKPKEGAVEFLSVSILRFLCKINSLLEGRHSAAGYHTTLDSTREGPPWAMRLSLRARCEEFAKNVFSQVMQVAHLPNYPEGCSDRRNHPSYGGVWWNTATGGDWNQHKGFRGEVALVCAA